MDCRIALICPTPTPRAQTHPLGKALMERGYDITFFVPIRGYNDTKAWADVRAVFFKSAFVPKIRYPIPNHLWMTKVLSQLEKSDYDVVQVCDYDYLTALIPCFSRRHPHSKRVVTIDAFPGVEWEFGSRFVDLTARLYSYSVGSLLLRAYDHVVLLYEKLTLSAKALGVQDTKIHVIPNSVDTQLFSRTESKEEARRQLGIDDKGQVVLCVARLSRVKGIDVLIQTARLLKRANEDVKFFVAGSGEDEKKLLRTADLKTIRCDLIGEIRQAELPRWYSAADVLALPSRSEGVPNAILEAASVGLPIVATDVGGVSSFIENGKNGLLVPREDASALARAIQEVLGSADMQERFIARARRKAIDEHSWKAVASKYDALYSEILAKNEET